MKGKTSAAGGSGPVHVLLVETTSTSARSFATCSRSRAYRVVLPGTVNRADGVPQGAFDLCLIDVMLPKMDGFALARAVRKADREVPLIFLTAKSLKEDKVEGLNSGGDDYVTKPFHTEELILRIEAVLRRTRGRGGGGEAEAALSIGAFRFEPRRANPGARRDKKS